MVFSAAKQEGRKGSSQPARIQFKARLIDSTLTARGVAELLLPPRLTTMVARFAE